MQKKLTKLQAYNVMLLFLEKLYKIEPSDYLGDILSNSEFWHDKIPGDRASWQDWTQAVQVTALQDKTLRNKNRLNLLQACRAMFNYIKNYVSFYIIKPEYLIKLLDLLTVLQNRENRQMWLLWEEVVDEIVQKDDPRMYLKFKSKNEV